MSKSDYLSHLLFNRKPFKQLTEAAIIFYHCDIKPLPATIYMDRLESKLIDKEK